MRDIFLPIGHHHHYAGGRRRDLAPAKPTPKPQSSVLRATSLSFCVRERHDVVGSAMSDIGWRLFSSMLLNLICTKEKKEHLQKRLDGLERSKRRVSVCLGLGDAKTLARALYGTCAFPVFIMSLLLSFWPGFPSASPRVSNTSAEALFNVSVYLVTNVRAHQKNLGCRVCMTGLPTLFG